MHRSIAPIAAALGLTLALSACTDPYDPGQRAVGGGLLGAGAGAAIGGVGGRWTRCRGGRARRRRGRRGRRGRDDTAASAAGLLRASASASGLLPAAAPPGYGRYPGY